MASTSSAHLQVCKRLSRNNNNTHYQFPNSDFIMRSEFIFFKNHNMFSKSPLKNTSKGIADPPTTRE